MNRNQHAESFRHMLGVADTQQTIMEGFIKLYEAGPEDQAEFYRTQAINALELLLDAKRGAATHKAAMIRLLGE